MKVYVDKKPESCDECHLTFFDTITCGGFERNVDTCVILKEETDNELYNICPLKELKPKELEWEEYCTKKHIVAHGVNDFESCRIYVAETPIGRAIVEVLINGRGIKINFPAITKYLFSCKELIKAKQSVENAKQFCQEHYNNLFWEMIGWKK